MAANRRGVLKALNGIRKLVRRGQFRHAENKLEKIRYKKFNRAERSLWEKLSGEVHGRTGPSIMNLEASDKREASRGLNEALATDPLFGRKTVNGTLSKAAEPSIKTSSLLEGLDFRWHSCQKSSHWWGSIWRYMLLVEHRRTDRIVCDEIFVRVNSQIIERYAGPIDIDRGIRKLYEFERRSHLLNRWFWPRSISVKVQVGLMITEEIASHEAQIRILRSGGPADPDAMNLAEVSLFDERAQNFRINPTTTP